MSYSFQQINNFLCFPNKNILWEIWSWERSYYQKLQGLRTKNIKAWECKEQSPNVLPLYWDFKNQTLSFGRTVGFQLFVCNLNLSLHSLWQFIFLGSIAAQYSSTWGVENQIDRHDTTTVRFQMTLFQLWSNPTMLILRLQSSLDLDPVIMCE